MALSIEASFTRTDKFLRAVVFLKDGKENVDAPVSVIFSGARDYIRRYKYTNKSFQKTDVAEDLRKEVLEYKRKHVGEDKLYQTFCLRQYIFIPAPKEKKTDPVYPEESGGHFVHRIEKGIYHATLFGKKAELNKVKTAKVFAGGEGKVFELKH